MSEVLLAARNVTKQFPGVLANDDISVQLRPGRILALLGVSELLKELSTAKAKTKA